jgi:ligand-binding sensor domain-containing protein/signal transduction histidine kinase
MFKYGRMLGFALLALWHIPAIAADTKAEFPFIVDVWGTSSGPLQRKLPSGVVISVLQTRDGYLWLGTWSGLVRFDGDRFTVFDESNTPGLPNGRIVFLFEDSRGWLWAGTDGGGLVVIHDGIVGRLGFGAGSSGGKVVSACEDVEGGVWFYTADGQVGRFFGDGLTALGTVPPSFRRLLMRDSVGRIWMGNDREQIPIGLAMNTNGIGLVRGPGLTAASLDFLLASRSGGFWRLADGRIEKWGTNQLERVLAKYPWTNSERIYVTSACEDVQGNLIVGVRNVGVFWFDANGEFSQIPSSPSVLSVCMDREGDLWLGTDGGGLKRVKRSVGSVAAGTSGSVVQSACEDAEGALWVGYNDNGGVVRLLNGVETNYSASGLISANVLSVFADKAGSIWVGTRALGGLHRFKDGKFELEDLGVAQGQEVSAIYQDRAGKMWAGTPAGLGGWDGQAWKIFTTFDGLSTNTVRAIVDDAAGNLWVGTAGGGLNQLRDGKFTVFRKSADGLPGDNVSSLLVDSEGTLWVGTSSGLARFKDGKWSRFTTSAGLPSNKINYLAEDTEGYLWIGANAGLLRMAKRSLDEYAAGNISAIACRIYDEADGLPTSECSDGSQPAALRTRAGKLWFPTIKGLVGIDATALTRNTNPPPVKIELVLLDGRELLTNGLRASLPSEIMVPPDAERLEIQFTSLNLAAPAPERARFRYQLENHEQHWSPPSNRREAIYPKLPPGNYVFHVTACNEDGVWNATGCSLVVRVLPPFWQTWWFLTICVLAVLGIVAGAVHFISTQKLQRELVLMRQKEALERERSRIARDLHDQLGANLTRVSLLGELIESDKDEPAEVEAHARQISKTTTETANALDEIVWAANPDNDTLEGLVTYICKYAQEFLTTAGVSCRLDVPTNLPATTIAPDFRHNVFLVAKEAVNNVVKHAHATSVRLQIKLEAGLLMLEVEDDGRGPGGAATAEERGRNGLRNMSRRMEDVGGSFSIGAAAKSGTIVRLAAPLNRI